MIDALLEYPARTPDLYEDKIAPLVDKTMNGFNSTIFAYVDFLHWVGANY
jgi:centromeric protein E